MEFARAAESMFKKHTATALRARSSSSAADFPNVAGAHRWSPMLLLIPVASQLHKIQAMSPNVIELLVTKTFPLAAESHAGDGGFEK